MAPLDDTEHEFDGLGPFSRSLLRYPVPRSATHEYSQWAPEYFNQIVHTDPSKLLAAEGVATTRSSRGRDTPGHSVWMYQSTESGRAAVGT